MLFTDWYEPGYKAGGPIKSCLNFVNQMKDEYEIFIFTSDRDLDEPTPYPNVSINNWITISNSVHVFYASPVALTLKGIKKEINNINPGFIYLNSMFSFKFTLLPLLAIWPGKKFKIILAPRGMLKQSALQFKVFKKKIFLAVFRSVGMPGRIEFHATDAAEVLEIKKQLGNKAKVFFIPNYAGLVKETPTPVMKTSGNIKIAFVGRIHPVKNLLFLVENLENIKGNITVSIAGNMEDPDYFKLCMQKAEQLNKNIEVKYHGGIPSSNIDKFLKENHILVLPTKGENFGHAIFESLSLGRPVIISNNTPWKELENMKAGFDISLEDQESFSNAIQCFVDMDNDEYQCWSQGAWKYVSGKSNNQQLKRKYLQLFS